MSSKYNIRLSESNTVEITKPNSSVVAYKFSYKQLQKKIVDTVISNRFIVYILVGKNSDKRTVLYVGKSKNGLDNRPTAHETDNIEWEHCYILTTFSERTFFNDGVIQYIENRISKMVSNNQSYINTTKVTNVETITIGDTEDCDEYIEEVVKMLYVLGLSLFEEKLDIASDKNKEVPTEIEDVYATFANALKTD